MAPFYVLHPQSGSPVWTGQHQVRIFMTVWLDFSCLMLFLPPNVFSLPFKTCRGHIGLVLLREPHLCIIIWYLSGMDYVRAHPGPFEGSDSKYKAACIKGKVASIWAIISQIFSQMQCNLEYSFRHRSF